jgi:hypothetical protein
LHPTPLLSGCIWLIWYLRRIKVQNAAGSRVGGGKCQVATTVFIGKTLFLLFKFQDIMVKTLEVAAMVSSNYFNW